ncbi:MAG: glycosyltransferase family 2 protein [Flavobacteriales bacterium]|nr:glycosyltransferase family 2 protein [Flavobacteriales bacterium]
MLIKIINFVIHIIFWYGLILMILYILFALSSHRSIKRYMRRTRFVNFYKLSESKYAPYISIIAPAYNESATVVDNVKSLLHLHYVNYEVVLVNDGSTDDTLEKLIREFSLKKIDFFFLPKIQTKAIRGIYKSTINAYRNLIVVDKENGGKSDALNTGINICSHDLIICMDTDGLVEHDALIRMTKPFLEQREKKIIASGGVIRIANQCEVVEGRLVKVHMPKKGLAFYQVLEYLRAFLLGRVAWANWDGLLLISGAFGMFDKATVVAAGGYSTKTVGEDLELVVRMRRYLRKKKIKYYVGFIPDPLCWTEVPSTARIFFRQRSRWTRGTIETIRDHIGLFFNPRYKVMGLFSFPYWFFYEWLAPIVETIGIVVTIILILLNRINWPFFLLLFLSCYFFALIFTTFSVLTDMKYFKIYKEKTTLRRLIYYIFTEPLLYHPMVTLSGIKGNIDFLLGRRSWGRMTRKGFATEGQKEPLSSLSPARVQTYNTRY